MHPLPHHPDGRATAATATAGGVDVLMSVLVSLAFRISTKRKMTDIPTYESHSASSRCITVSSWACVNHGHPSASAGGSADGYVGGNRKASSSGGKCETL